MSPAWCIASVVAFSGAGIFFTGWYILKTCDSMRENLAEELKALEEERQKLKERIEELENELKKLEEERKELTKKVEMLETLLSDRESEIRRLVKELEERRGGRKGKRRRILLD